MEGCLMEKPSPEEKIVNLMRSSAPGQDQSGNNQSVHIAGDGNIVGNGNTVIKTEKVTTKTTATPIPGAEHITESQIRVLHDLKDEIIRLESLAKKDPATAQRVWSAVNKSCGVGSMRMIPLEKFNKAEKFLRQWIGRLTDTKSVKNKDPEGVRKSRIRYIQTNMKKLGIEDPVRAYMHEHFDASSLKDLDLPALEKVYHYVASKKRSLKA